MIVNEKEKKRGRIHVKKNGKEEGVSGKWEKRK